MGRHEQELVVRLRRHAAGLRYHGADSLLKVDLYESARALENQQVSVDRVEKTWMVRSACASRPITWRERLALWLLRGATEIRP